MDWQKLLSFWGPISGLAIIVFYIAVLGLQIRDEWKGMRHVLCDRAISGLNHSIAQIATAKPPDTASEVYVAVNKADLEWTLKKLEHACLE